ncbi:MAG TPA: cation diffusion facilitator family transporter [Chitinophagales bacterium]|nr:cation diffusion facilitator family transporter [Chitinophagales bacterium]
MAKPNPSQATYRIQFIAVVVGVLLLAARFAAYLFTHSNAILTDALESIVNIVAGVFALYSLYLSSKPKDYDHPYGHGKVEFISAGFEGILITLAGIMIIGKSIFSFFQPRPLEHLDTGLMVIALSGVVNYGLGFILVSAGNKYQSLTLRADGEHLKSDAYSSLGILIGLVLIIFTGLNWLDNVIAIVFGCIIIYTGIKLARRSVAGIMDEADEQLISELVQHLKAHRKTEWIDIHNLRIIQFGNKLHIDCHVTLPWYYTLRESHQAIEEVAAVINDTYTYPVEFFIHGDPCIPECCKICSISDCKVRQDAFTGKIEWTVSNVRQNKKHGL